MHYHNSLTIKFLLNAEKCVVVVLIKHDNPEQGHAFTSPRARMHNCPQRVAHQPANKITQLGRYIVYSVKVHNQIFQVLVQAQCIPYNSHNINREWMQDMLLFYKRAVGPNILWGNLLDPRLSAPSPFYPQGLARSGSHKAPILLDMPMPSLY